MKRLLLATLLVLPLLTWSGPATAHDEDFTEINVILGAHSTRITDGALDYYSNDDWLTSGYLAAEVEVYDNLHVQLGILMSDMEHDLFGEFDSRLRIREPRLAVRYGYTFLHAIRPYASLAMTYAFLQSEMDLWSGTVTGIHDGWLDGELGGRAALGCEFFLPRRIFGKDSGLFKDFTFGMALEIGYALVQPFDMDRVRHGKDGNVEKSPELPAGYIDMGQLDRSGLFISYDVRLYF